MGKKSKEDQPFVEKEFGPCPSCGGMRLASRSDEADTFCYRCRIPGRRGSGLFGEVILGAGLKAEYPSHTFENICWDEIVGHLRTKFGDGLSEADLLERLEKLLLSRNAETRPNGEMVVDRNKLHLTPIADVLEFVRGEAGKDSERFEENPSWDCDKGELSFRGQVVRTVSGQANNIRTLLDAFQEMNWPARIDDPLPGGKNQARVNDTCGRLNDNLRALRFFGDGSGAGFAWEVAE